MQITRVGLVAKTNLHAAAGSLAELAGWLEARGVRAVFDTHTASIAGVPSDRATVDRDRLPAECDLIVVLGGDGTLIGMADRIAHAGVEVPILGVNYGSLGYLTEFRIEEMFSAIEAIIGGDYAVDPRVMLDVELIRGDKVVSEGRILNDVVINKAALARIIEIEVHLNTLYVNLFRSDGLIVATPTGSTAYNLSAGGPIVYPSMNALVLTPICPFTLTNRPIVVPDAAEIELMLVNENEGVVLSLDGQIGFPMIAGDRVRICKSATPFNMVQPTNRNYFDVLRDKLKWGR